VLQSDRIAQTEPLLASRILDEAERLAGNPTLLSTRGSPLSDTTAILVLVRSGRETQIHVHLFFQYGADELTIWITGIGVVRY
jgi:hypothetical protein